MKINDAFLIGGLRTPIGSLGGTLSSIRPDDMAALVIQSLVSKYSSIDVNEISDVILGCANQAGEDNRNVARMAVLLSGLPVSVGGETVNRLCASGLSASIAAARSIQTNDAELMISGGVESMTRSPFVISKTASAYGRDAQMYDSTFGWRFINQKLKEMYGTDSMGQTAENVAALYKISREDQDKFAFWSQQKAKIAQQSGRFSTEIVPVPVTTRKRETLIFEHDEFLKPDTNLEILTKLRPAFDSVNGSVTAGNASGLNDGAAALLWGSEKAVLEYNLKPQARIVSMGVAGVSPHIMGIGPVLASQIALKKAGLSINEMDIIELNEAFAAQSLACVRGLGLADDDARINPNGGAIALGHPLGMSGARILNSAAVELQNTNKRYALVTMCIGVGQGYAVIIERA
jgi:3-oxoadipyl-CoA thiolase